MRNNGKIWQKRDNQRNSEKQNADNNAIQLRTTHISKEKRIEGNFDEMYTDKLRFSNGLLQTINWRLTLNTGST